MLTGLVWPGLAAGGGVAAAGVLGTAIDGPCEGCWPELIPATAKRPKVPASGKERRRAGKRLGLVFDIAVDLDEATVADLQFGRVPLATAKKVVGQPRGHERHEGSAVALDGKDH